MELGEAWLSSYALQFPKVKRLDTALGHCWHSISWGNSFTCTFGKTRELWGILLYGILNRIFICAKNGSDFVSFILASILQKDSYSSEPAAESYSWFFDYPEHIKRTGNSTSVDRRKCPHQQLCARSLTHFLPTLLSSSSLKWSVCDCCQRSKAMWTNFRLRVC